jgi:hypothetical protein
MGRLLRQPNDAALPSYDSYRLFFGDGSNTLGSCMDFDRG